MLSKILKPIEQAFAGAGRAMGGGLRVIRARPQILVYPWLAALFILLTFPLVNTVVFKIWDAINPDFFFSAVDETPNNLKILLGLVTFSFFYTTFVTAFFSVATAAEVERKMQNKNAPLSHGLKSVIKTLPRTAKFAALAIFFFPLSIFAQRKRSAKELHSIIGSSLSLNMAQMAPVVLSEKKTVMASIRQSVDTLGTAWKENLVIKIASWLSIFLILSLGFLPSLLEDNWIDADSAELIGSLSAILLSFAAYVVTKVISAIFTAVLYHQARNNK